MNNYQAKADFIWSVADLLRGDYKQSEYGKVMLPLTVLRRLDCVLEPTKAKVLERAKTLPARADDAMKDMMLGQTARQSFYNLSRFVFQKTDAVTGKGYASLLGDQEQIAANLKNYVAGFSVNAREVFLDKFKFGEQIDRLDEANLLFLVVGKFTEIDLHPDVVDNIEMGYIFEELIRRFSEASNETAGEHFTPREVIRLMVNLLFNEDGEALTKKGVIRTLYDPACGTGGMLSVAENYLRELNEKATLKVFGQELNPESYAICKSDMLIKGEDATHIKFGNSFTQDGLSGERFDYLLSNPPFGVEWKKVEKDIRDEHQKLGMGGRFGAGLPRVSDGSLKTRSAVAVGRVVGAYQYRTDLVDDIRHTRPSSGRATTCPGRPSTKTCSTRSGRSWPSARSGATTPRSASVPSSGVGTIREVSPRRRARPPRTGAWRSTSSRSPGTRSSTTCGATLPAIGWRSWSTPFSVPRAT